jgi:spermidine/putrescine transport system ATP-binding protein
MQLELKRIQQELGITFVFVTHDQEEALTMSDRIAVMTQGRVDQIGTPTEIYHQPSSVFVAGFIGTANLLPVTVAAADGDTIAVESPLVGRLVVPAGGQRLAMGADVTLMVRPERLRIGPSSGDGVEATLTGVVFQGPVLRCQARTDIGTDLVAHVGVGEMPNGVQPGDRVRLAWDQNAAYLVPEAIAADQAGVTRIDEDESAAVA